MAGTICITSDYWWNDRTAQWYEMYIRGFRGTYFVAPETVNTSTFPNSDDLTLLKAWGHELGGYTNNSGDNMVTMFANNRATALAKLNTIKSSMATLGFPIVSLAPTGRVWNTNLANICTDLYKQVRVCNTGSAIQSYPIPNPLFVNDAAFASLGTGVTLQQVKDNIDAAIAANGLAVFVIHKIGPTADPYTWSNSDWTAMLDYLTSKGSQVRVVPFREAMTQG